MPTTTVPVSLPRLIYRLIKKFSTPRAFSVLRLMAAPDRSAPASIASELEDRARTLPHHTAIKYLDRHWTWSEFNRWANQYAAYFLERGIKKGDVIAVNMTNRPEVLVLIAAAAKIGAITAMINTSQRDNVLVHSLRLSQPKLIVAGEEQLDTMSTVSEFVDRQFSGSAYYVPNDDIPTATRRPPEGDGIYTDITALVTHCAADNPSTSAEQNLNDKCYLIFTSGTTGMPKASVMSNFRWFRSAKLMGEFTLGMTADDTLYCCLPFYHNNALTIAFGACVTSGAAIAISPRFSASRFWDECRHYQATTFCYIGELLRYLLNQPARADDSAHSIRAIVGNGLRTDLWQSFKVRFGIERIHEFYASSEGNSAFINAFNFDETCGWNPAGWEIVHYDLENETPSRNSDGFLRKLGKGHVGLLLTKVDDHYPYDGYTDPGASDAKLLHNVFAQGDCWFNTGDLVKRLGWGHIQFVDRVGDTFRWQGENVATTEVEAVLNAWPGTAEAVVYGVQVPGCDGRCGMVSYTAKPGETLDLDGLANFLRTKLPKYAVPRFMRVSEQQASTGTFKHIKASLKKEAYDVEAVTDPLYVLPPDAESWIRVDTALKHDIDSGRIRL